MKKIIILLSLFCGNAFAGGTIGGGGSGLENQDVLELMSMGGTVGGNPMLTIESLPKSYISGDDLRRVKARLSVAGTLATSALVDGDMVDLKTFRDSVVDVKFSKEVLPLTD